MTDSVACVGAGLIGRAWAVVFARGGRAVRLWDADADAVPRALAWLDETLPAMASLGLIDDAATLRARVVAAPTLEACVAGVAYVQESVPEDLAIKRETHRRIEAAAPAEAVVGSSASALTGSRIFAGLAREARCLVAHPANPPHLMPVVELVPSPATAPAAVARTLALMAECGQVPVALKREIEGFVLNRLQAGVVNEAISLVAAGVIEPDDLDAVMRHSLGLRWSFMGPFETMDLNAPAGFLDYATRYGETYRRLGEQLGVARAWNEAACRTVEAARRARVPAAALAARQAWRDRRLMALAAHKHQHEKE